VVSEEEAFVADIASQTPEGFNQSPPFADVNLYETDRVLLDAVMREVAGGASTRLAAFGSRAGSAETSELGRRANENPPNLTGSGIDALVTYDGAYHQLMTISMDAGLHCSTWEHLLEGTKPRAHAHVARCAGFYMAAQMEAGHCCPVTMTHAAVAALQNQPDILEEWLPKILSRRYDPAFAPVTEKASATLGMGMTEIQGGTDVRANITRAEPVVGGGPGGEYSITGHKYFMSAPMSDAFLVLAQAPGGLSCFLMPRFQPDGALNAIHVLRLKDKLGNRSNASSEVEFHGAYAQLIGEEGRGVRTILDMVTLTRLDCAVSSAGLMRFALAHAIHHCRHRSVFQKKLIDQPLMERVLADMALHAEAAAMLVFRLARAFDGMGDETELAYRRLITPVAKYWVCKTAPAFVYEAMECLGGIGYVENASPLARLYREAPVNAIWEGSGNVMCLDVLRVIQRDPGSVELVFAELGKAVHGESRLEAHLEQIKGLLARSSSLEADGRILTGLLAELAAGALMFSHAPGPIADAYLSTRFSGARDAQPGSVELRDGAREIVERALPHG
jgi:putative acyl-CoA dehydrogenase